MSPSQTGDTGDGARVSTGDKVSGGADGVGGGDDGEGSGWTQVNRRGSSSRQRAPQPLKTMARHQGGTHTHPPGAPAGRSTLNPQNRRNQRRLVIHTQPKSGTPPTNWKDVCFATSSAVDERRKLKYVPPKIVDGKKIAALDQFNTLKAQEKWIHTITGYIMGKRPFFPHLKANVTRQWKIKGSLDILTRENGFFLFKLSQAEDYENILENGPWFFDGRLMVLKPWNASAGLDMELLNSISTWIQLPGLNLKAWTQSSIEKIASIIGTPILLDKYTANDTRMEFARCLVEIEAAADQPDFVTVELEDGFTYEQPIKYEWIPKKCENCISFDHVSSECIRAKRTDMQALQQEKIYSNKEGENRLSKSAIEEPLKEMESNIREAGVALTMQKTQVQSNSEILNQNPKPMECSPSVCGKVAQEVVYKEAKEMGMDVDLTSLSGIPPDQEFLEPTELNLDQPISSLRKSHSGKLGYAKPSKGSPAPSTLVHLQNQITQDQEINALSPHSEMDLDLSMRGSATNTQGSPAIAPLQERSATDASDTFKSFPNWSFSSSDQENLPPLTMSNPNWSLNKIHITKDIDEQGPKRKGRKKHKAVQPYAKKNQQADQASTECPPTQSLE